MTSSHAEAQARYRAGDLAGARRLFEAAVPADPGHWAVHHDLGTLLRQLGERRRARHHVRSSLVLSPEAALAWTTAGLLEGDTGAFPRARRMLDRARLIAPDDPVGLLARADLAEDHDLPDYIGRVGAALRRPALPERMKARLLHALGKLRDRADDVDGAFSAISAAHAIRRRERPYDPAEDSAFFDSVVATCDHAWWRRPGNAAAAAVRPVFVVGLPRSGTTLLEQMLSRHPEVDAGGESLALQTVLAAELPQRLGSGFPDCLAAAGPQDWSWAAQRYLALSAERRSGAPVFTDKLPANFLLVGPILKMFPDARVLHMTRDPLDTGLSCYLTDFAHGQNYATDLGFIAHHFRLHRSLMVHWHGFGDRRLRDVSYEDLVAAPEAALRAALAHCGLDWHPDCLAFSRSAHAVNTASWKRVRGPLDTRRTGHWRRYAHRLGRLAGRLASPDGEPIDVLRRTLAWEPGLAAETLALAEATAPARDVLARLPAVGGGNVGLLSRAASAADRAGLPPLARRLLTAAAHAAPGVAAIQLNLAVACGRTGETGAAVGALRRALTLSPGLPEAWSNLGNVLTAAGLPEALLAHRRALCIAPGEAGFHGNRGHALQRSGDGTTAATRCFRRALALDPAGRTGGMSLVRLTAAGRSDMAGLPLLDRLRCAHPLEAEIHYERGCALRDAGRDVEAAASLRRALVLEPQRGDWRHVLDALVGRPRGSASVDYVRALFDQYADSFDQHLTEGLAYRTPTALIEALCRARPGTRSFARVLDLGCGTGLMGAALRSRFTVGHMTGVDVSGAMLARLREKGGYDAAAEADVQDFLERDGAAFDLIVAADVLVYLGALERLMAGARRALAPDGLLAVSVEEGLAAPFELRRSGRYAHRRDYLEATAAAAGLRIVSCTAATLRKERGLPVTGLIAVLAAGSTGPTATP